MDTGLPSAMIGRMAGERRRSTRLPVEMQVQFRHLRRPRLTYAEVARNVSQGGLYVESTVGFEPGTVVDLEVFPGPGAKGIRVTAEVVRVEEEIGETGSRSDGRSRGMGLRFVRSSAEEVARLVALAEALSREGSG